MERFNTSAGSAGAPVAPAAPVNKYFTKGNPTGGIPATVPGEWWYHMITEEMRAVLIEGGLTPDHTVLTQLRDAIKNMIAGRDYKDSVRVASTAAINLAAPGANIDGIAMVAGDRFLEKDNATQANRGIYIWNGAAVPATRATDADIGTEFNSGTIIPVEQGTTNADTLWMMTADGTITIGTTALTFVQFSQTPDASTTVKGKVQLATSAEAQALTDALKAITPATLAAAFGGANQSLAASGYQKIPGGLILQWGYTSAAMTVGQTLVQTLPITFPNANLWSGTGGASANTSGGGADSGIAVTAKATNTMSIYNGYDGTTSTTVPYFAVGY